MNPFLETVLSNVVFAAALAVVVAVVTTFWRNRHAAHLLWVLVLVKLVTPPVWNVPLAMGDAFEPRQSEGVDIDRPVSPATNIAIEPVQATSTLPAIDASSIVMEPLAPPPARQFTEVEPSTGADIAPVPPRPAATSAATEPPIDWSWLLPRAWIATSALWLLAAVVRIMKFHRLVRRSPLADGSLMSQVERLSTRLGLRSRPAVRVLDGNVSPMVWPLTWKRSLLLPRKLLEELTPSQLDTVIAHELAHLVRRDDWIRFLEAAVTCLFWWNPVVWWARRELHRAEEDCCDALVVCALPESRRQYGEALLRAAEIVTFGRSLPALASAFAQQRFLKRRIEMILMQEFRRGLSWPFKVLLLALAVAVLPLAATAVDEPGTSEDTTGEPESSQFGIQATAEQGDLSSSPPVADSAATPSSITPETIQSDADGAPTAIDAIPSVAIRVLPGRDLSAGGFGWHYPMITAIPANGGWTFVDLDDGNSAQISAEQARARDFEMQGFDIRGRSWNDEFEDRDEYIAVPRGIAYQELRNGLEGLSAADLVSLAQAPLREETIHPGVGIFRTAEGNLGVLEFTNVEGQGQIKYELVARVELVHRVGDPIPATGAAATVTRPAPHPQAANLPAQSISSDAEVQQLELELLKLDEEAVRIQLAAEMRKLEHARRLAEQGVAQADVSAQELAVQLLEIEVERAQIRTRLYETQINRQRGAWTDGDTGLNPSNTPASATEANQPTSNVPADPEPSTLGSLYRNGFLPGEPSSTNGDPNLNSNNPADPRATLDALNELNQNSVNAPGDPLQQRIEQYEEAFRIQSESENRGPDAGSNPPPGEAFFPRPVHPEGPMAVVRGVIVERGKPIADKVIWIIGEEDGETVLYQDGPSSDDGTFEFPDVPVGRPWRVFIPYENGPWGFDSGTMITLDDTSDVAIEIAVAGDTVTATLVEDAASD